MHQSKSTLTIYIHFISNSLFIVYNDSIYKESIVDLEGIVSAAPEKITGCSQQDVELVVNKVYLLCIHCVMIITLCFITGNNSMSSRSPFYYNY